MNPLDDEPSTEVSNSSSKLVSSSERILSQLHSSVRVGLLTMSLACAFAVWGVFFVLANYLNSGFFFAGTTNPLSVLFSPLVLAGVAVASVVSSGLIYFRARRGWTELDNVHVLLHSFGEETGVKENEAESAGQAPALIDACITVADKLPAWTEGSLKLKARQSATAGAGVFLLTLLVAWTDSWASLFAFVFGAVTFLYLNHRARVATGLKSREVEAWMRTRESQEDLVRHSYE